MGTKQRQGHTYIEFNFVTTNNLSLTCTHHTCLLMHTIFFLGKKKKKKKLKSSLTA